MSRDWATFKLRPILLICFTWAKIIIKTELVYVIFSFDFVSLFPVTRKYKLSKEKESAWENVCKSNQICAYSTNLAFLFYFLNSLFGSKVTFWYDYNNPRNTGSRERKEHLFLSWLAQLYRQETYTQGTDPHHPIGCEWMWPAAHPPAASFFKKKK